jgi:hypothetical protein
VTDIDTDSATMIGEPWFFPDRVQVPRVPHDPADITPHSTDHHVVSRPSKLGKTWQVGLLSCIVIIVLVALMITGGRALRNTGSTTRPKLAPPEAVPSDWIAYRDPNSVFLIWHPPPWIVERSGSSTDITDPQTGTRLRIDHHDPVPPPADAEWLPAEATFAASHSDYSRLQMAATTYGGAPAALWEYIYSDNAIPLHAANLGFSTKTNGYTLSFQAPIQDWERALPLFTDFKASFRIPPSK